MSYTHSTGTTPTPHTHTEEHTMFNPFKRMTETADDKAMRLLLEAHSRDYLADTLGGEYAKKRDAHNKRQEQKKGTHYTPGTNIYSGGYWGNASTGK